MFSIFYEKMHKLFLENKGLWRNNNFLFRLKLVNFQETTDFLSQIYNNKKKKAKEREREREIRKKNE